MDEDQIRVAKLVIVAWIKNWDCSTLYNVITGKKLNHTDEAFELNKKYKFLPVNLGWYLGKKSINGKPVRKFIFDLNKKLSDALWDTEDNIKRLSFATYLAKLNAKNLDPTSKYEKSLLNQNYRTKQKLNWIKKEMEYHKEYNQKMNGTHWGTVK
jgi:hypothetical protein